MVLFVCTVVAAVGLATAATTRARHRRRAVTTLAVVGVVAWTLAAAVLAVQDGVPPAFLAALGVALAHVTGGLCRRVALPRPRGPVHWSVLAAGGVAAVLLEGYWSYHRLDSSTGVLEDVGALATFGVLSTVTIAVTGVVSLAQHMRRVNPAESPELVPAGLRRAVEPGALVAATGRRTRLALDRVQSALVRPASRGAATH